MNTMVSAASLSTATAAVALPTARAQPGPQEVSFPPGVVDRLVRIRERSFIQRQKDKAHRLAGTDPFYEDGDKVWDELLEEQCAAADAILSRSPQSIADLAWQAEAVLICDGPDMLESEKVYGLIQLFENVRALAGPLAIPSTVSFPEIVDPVFAVIERHKALSVACDTAAENSTTVVDSHPDKDDLDEVTSQACDELIEHAQKLFEFRPASLSGVATLLKYIASLQDWQMPGRFGEPDEIEGMQDLCRTMAAAIEPFSTVRRVATPSSNAGRDPIFAAIEAHQRAVVVHGEAVSAESALEQSLPLDRQQSDITAWEEKIVETDDPRWLVAVRVRDETSNAMDDLAIDLLNTEPTTIAGTEALLRYFTDQEEAFFPNDVSNDDGSTETFEVCLIHHVADALRKITRPSLV